MCFQFSAVKGHVEILVEKKKKIAFKNPGLWCTSISDVDLVHAQNNRLYTHWMPASMDVE